MNHLCTVVVKAVCDLMPNNHSYSTKVKGLVLLFTEERRLQDSCWKHLTDKNNRSDTMSKQDYNEVCLCFYLKKHMFFNVEIHSGFVDSHNALTYLVSVG